MEKLKVLLVDDDLTFGCIAVKVLESAGFAVHYQNSLFGIESLIVKFNPNIIILDVMIGDDNSLERINNIRLASEDIPIIIVSSHDELEFEEQAVSNGAVVYLEKPFTSEKLVMWVANSTSKCKITKCFCKSTLLELKNSIFFLVSH